MATKVSNEVVQRHTVVQSPVGPIRLTSNGGALTHLSMLDEGDPAALVAADSCEILDLAATELAAYFQGTLRTFTVPLAPQGTEFQQRVWNCLTQIPYGTTISYLELATRAGNAKAIRAVGAANGRNPIGLIIPCHRVIGANGTLVGYSGGLWRKVALLKLEGVNVPADQAPQRPDWAQPAEPLGV
ncbi:MAG: methylated-DNA--[protein]-cysteine S-methyltransferase [Planctomycetota bacterium]|nr:methylated-DNA--[protein]-cysteine S-methyltransferase [Planctomycetota bacterium]